MTKVTKAESMTNTQYRTCISRNKIIHQYVNQNTGHEKKIIIQYKSMNM